MKLGETFEWIGVGLMFFGMCEIGGLIIMLTGGLFFGVIPTSANVPGILFFVIIGASCAGIGFLIYLAGSLVKKLGSFANKMRRRVKKGK